MEQVVCASEGKQPDDLSNGSTDGGFQAAFEGRMRLFFDREKRFSTILWRSVLWSLIDFPIVMANFPFVMTSLFFRSLLPFFPSSDRLRRYAQWFRHRRSRHYWIGRLLPPYRTVAARSKLAAFERMVIRPLEEGHPAETRSVDFQRAEHILIESLTSWEKVPSLMENVLTPFCWLLGISFVGLDPKTAFVLSRDKQIYHRWAEMGQGWLGKTLLRVRWLFDDTVPWTYSAKFVAVGVLAYIVLMVLIEFSSVQIIYRKGVERRLAERILQASDP